MTTKISFAERMNNNWGKIIILIFIIFIFISKNYTDRIGEKNLEKLFNSEYKGIILKKFSYRGLNIIFKNLKTKKESNINSTEILYENSRIGDTIIKISNSNLCIIKNKNKNIKVKCYELDFKK